MKFQQRKEFVFKDGESFQQKVCGIHRALDLIAAESRKLGLKYTSHLSEAAAYSALVEISQSDAEDHPIQSNIHPFEH